MPVNEQTIDSLINNRLQNRITTRSYLSANASVQINMTREPNPGIVNIFTAAAISRQGCGGGGAEEKTHN